MSTNKDLVRRLYTELDRHNFAIYRELCSEDFVSHFPGRPTPQTREERERVSRDFYRAFPDLTHTIKDLVAEGERVAARLSVTGTSTDALDGLGPTGDRVFFTAMRFYWVDAGRLVEEWAEFDNLGLLKQLDRASG